MRPAHWLGASGAGAGAPPTRVRAFETIPYGWSQPAALTPRLQQWLAARKRSRGAWVTVWGVSRSAAEAGAIREVAFVGAAAADIRVRLQPLTDAGIVVEGVSTPALALCSVARLRRDQIPGVPIALLAIGATSMGLAVSRDGVPLFAREIPWGYQEPGARTPSREEFAAKLAAELKRSFVFFRQIQRAEVTQCLVCGDYPQLRSLTAPLIMSLDLEIETLDSLEGFDPASLPGSLEVFRERVAEFRLAWGVAADPAPPVNLLPPQTTARPKTARRAAAMSAAAAALVIAAAIWLLTMPASSSRPQPPELGTSRAATGEKVGTASISPPASNPNSEPRGDQDPLATPGTAATLPRTSTEIPRPTPTKTPPQPQSEIAAEPAAPEPVVRSILFSAERRVALIDARIVGVGDQVSAGRVIAIERDAVVIETHAGQTRRLELKPRLVPGGLK